MWKRLLLVIVLIIPGIVTAMVLVDVNQANQAALENIKGIGPKTARAILDERDKAGPFRDWDDFTQRVKGIGDKRSGSFSKAGLTINGQAKDAGNPMPAKTTAPVKAEIYWSRPGAGNAR